MRIQFERAFASILITIGIILIIFVVFQAYSYEKELSAFAETLKEKGITENEALGHNVTWFFTLLTELVGGFFLASIGVKIIKK